MKRRAFLFLALSLLFVNLAFVSPSSSAIKIKNNELRLSFTDTMTLSDSF